MKFAKPTKIRNPAYLIHLRDEPCEAKFMGECFGDVVGAHLDGAGNKGTGTKTDDCYAGSLCVHHHTLESNGWARFYHKLFAEDTFYLITALKAYRLLKHLRWLVSEGKTEEAIQLLGMK